MKYPKAWAPLVNLSHMGNLESRRSERAELTPPSIMRLRARGDDQLLQILLRRPTLWRIGNDKGDIHRADMEVALRTGHFDFLLAEDAKNFQH